MRGAGGAGVLFFFSSRRRHTRFDCDWSSDVCSSDLESPIGERRGELPRAHASEPVALAGEREDGVRARLDVAVDGPREVDAEERELGVGDRIDEAARSEEHTSELQSQSNLVCRLLLEKKK